MKKRIQVKTEKPQFTVITNPVSYTHLHIMLELFHKVQDFLTVHGSADAEGIRIKPAAGVPRF